MSENINYYKYIASQKEYLLYSLDANIKERIENISSKFSIDEFEIDDGISIITDEFIEKIQGDEDNDYLRKWLMTVLQPYHFTVEKNIAESVGTSALFGKLMKDENAIEQSDSMVEIDVFIIASTDSKKYSKLQSIKDEFRDYFNKEYKSSWKNTYKVSVRIEYSKGKNRSELQSELDKKIVNANIILVWLKDEIGGMSEREILLAWEQSKKKPKTIYLHRIIDTDEEMKKYDEEMEKYENEEHQIEENQEVRYTAPIDLRRDNERDKEDNFDNIISEVLDAVRKNNSNYSS